VLKVVVEQQVLKVPLRVLKEPQVTQELKERLEPQVL